MKKLFIATIISIASYSSAYAQTQAELDAPKVGQFSSSENGRRRMPPPVMVRD
ncbi:hypothetical protein [Acetobacter cerevisiae]|uniref:hypothetical protein n=1 Tax=Acetobacter cerevisiae TaxID=178900 RepID=UPI00209D9467|nr:hypothetical protein [Acetobacter cerevisiae]MCP1270737.1 hypothetical protein [Acetobacter cerevisiae]MCP1278739.1 hypothetical protein [Acetobacter cerevisiae]